MTDLLIQIGNGDTWQNCRLFQMSHGNNHYIRIAIEDGQDHITLYGLRAALAHKLRALLALVEGHTIPEPVADFITPRTVTPLETIEKFKSSEVLGTLAGDVETALRGMVGDADQVRQALDINDLFDSQGHPIRGAQSRIAEVLGITNAGAYRPRILKILKTLQSEYSTTQREPKESYLEAA